MHKVLQNNFLVWIAQTNFRNLKTHLISKNIPFSIDVNGDVAKTDAKHMTTLLQELQFLCQRNKQWIQKICV